MTAILSLLIVITLAVVITRIASTALTLTGLSLDVARFQARSALTGCGFTTNEAEDMVRHPVRRRIVMVLMLLGNAGLVTSVSTLLLSFMNVASTGTALVRGAVLLAGLAALWLLTRSQWLDKQMSRLFERLLRRWTSLEIRDYARLLNLTGEFTVAEVEVQEGDWLADQRIRELGLPEEGIIVLAIRREGGDYVGVPSGDERLYAGDSVVVYGQDESVQALDERSSGASGRAGHADAVEKESRRMREQQDRERRREQLSEQQAEQSR